ncbi:MAG: helix-turn-helix domain-containing protein [Monoglobales bacterium]
MNRIYQNVILQLKDLYNRRMGVIDSSGSLTACTYGLLDTQTIDYILKKYSDPNAFYSYNGFTYKPVGNRNKLEFITFCEGSDEVARTCCSVLAITLSNIKILHDEKYDKNNLVKNILMDNILPGDILVKAKDLHLAVDVSRVVFIIQTTGVSNFSIYDILQNLFPEKGKNFIINVDEHYLALVREVKEDTDPKDLDKIARSIVDTLYTEALTKVYVGIGSICGNIRDLALSYKEAQVALEVGKVFDIEKQIINYESLGIGRLIYQLPTTLCELFLSEVFKKESLDVLDQETILTIQKFFKHNLNVSETARELFVHRNTLVYRLDKIEKVTGLDLREFDQAVTFKVAMMVKKYLSSNVVKF